VSGTALTGTTPPKGTYKYNYQNQRSEDGCLTGASPSATGETGSGGQIDLSVLTANADATFDFTRPNRTLKNQARFYRITEIARAGSTHSDIATDTLLTTTQAPVIYNERQFRTHRAGHIPRFRWCNDHQDRIWMGGAWPKADYTQGTITVTKDSTTATVAGGYPLADWEGRTLKVAATSEEYLIVAVNTATKALTLDRNYEVTGGAGKSYTVTDNRSKDSVFFTEVRKHNQLPSQNEPRGITSLAGKGTVAGLSIWGEEFVWTRDGLWRIPGQNANSYALRKVSGAAGAVAGRAVLEVDNAIYWLSPEGVVRLYQDGGWENLSRPQVVQGAVRGNYGTIKRINWPHAHLAHAINHPDSSVIRFFVPLDDEIVPGHAIVYDIQTGAFSLDRVPDITASGLVTKPDGSTVVLLGSLTGEIFEADIGNCDGAFGFEPKTTSTANTVNTWTDSGAAFPTTGNGLKGIPFVYFNKDGTFGRTVIQSNTATVLTFTRSMDTALTVGSQGYVGGIPGHFKPGRFTLGLADEDKTISVMNVIHSPDTDGKYIVAAGKNQDALTIPWVGGYSGDLTDTSGDTLFDLGLTGRFHQYEIYAIEPGCDPHFLSIDLTVHARSKVRVPV
jgi:hypothetical protein